MFLNTSAYADWDDLSSEGLVPLSEKETYKLFQQCSRSAPDPKGSIWVPQRETIRELEARLPSFISKHTSYGKTKHIKSIEYRGQYAGFEHNGKKYIYASYAPASVYEHNKYKTGSALIACDGGWKYWGVVYHIATKQLSDVSFNGWR